LGGRDLPVPKPMRGEAELREEDKRRYFLSSLLSPAPLLLCVKRFFFSWSGGIFRAA